MYNVYTVSNYALYTNYTSKPRPDHNVTFSREMMRSVQNIEWEFYISAGSVKRAV